MSFGDPDLRLAVWALLKRLKACRAVACDEPGHDPRIYNCERALNGWEPLIYNCERALNGWEPPGRDAPVPSDGAEEAWEAGYMKGINDGCRNPN